MSDYKDVDELAKKITDWAVAMFGPADDAYPQAKVLAREVDELRAALYRGIHTHSAIELAQCFGLILDIMRRLGLPFQALLDTTVKVHERNMNRKWFATHTDDKGYTYFQHASGEWGMGEDR